jgi:ketosteroid isomerase-like protein
VSQAHVDLTRRFVAAYNARDADAMEQLCSDSFEFESTFVAIEGRTYRGRDTMRGYFADLAEGWEVFQLEDVEYLDAGNRVLAVFNARARGRSSGAEVKPALSTLFSFTDGEIQRLETFEDREEAFRVSGLRP